MSRGASHPTEPRLLPGGNLPAAAMNAPGPAIVPTAAPSRQLSELPRDELEHLAVEYGLEPGRYATRQLLVAALHARRQMIASFDRDAMLDVIRWGRRPVTAGATKEQIAQEIARIRSMRFAGLSQRGLVVLARLRGIDVDDAEPVPALIRKVRKREGFFSRLGRKRRAILGSLVANMIGDNEPGGEYQFLPSDGAVDPASAASTRAPSLKEDIEESGLFGGISNRLKKTADAYLNQKLDEIEGRIDRKLDEIDRRLAEWRDKEVANRLRILKITLWASVIVGVFSLIYSYVVEVFVHHH